ncbi:MAG: sigma-70 family RNA polymerase sigma factor [Planctomycetes bacterium]|nr:sigma-70 family RNA polymerase sigma factor [Planctomycetota bacterium]
MTELTTLELLDRWHAGDNDALAELVRRHAGWLRMNIRRRMSAKMRLDGTSEDVVQSVLLNLLSSGPSFRPANEAQFRALVSKAVFNRLCELHDYITRQRRDPDRAQAMGSQASRVCIPDSSRDRPDRQAGDAEERGFIAVAMLLIEPEDRRLVQWHDFDGVEFAEIGDRLSMSEEGARSRYRRALARLRVQVERLKRGQTDDLVRELEASEAPQVDGPT